MWLSKALVLCPLEHSVSVGDHDAGRSSERTDHPEQEFQQQAALPLAVQRGRPHIF
jgi:hypothetical protein